MSSVLRAAAMHKRVGKCKLSEKWQQEAQRQHTAAWPESRKGIITEAMATWRLDQATSSAIQQTQALSSFTGAKSSNYVFLC